MPRKHVASYNWRTDPAYKMKEGHPNKMMRPSTHKLLDKLRNMQMLQEPGMVNVLIYDLAHHFLYREKQVVLLGQIAARLTQMWVGLVYNSEDKPAELYGNPEYRPIEKVQREEVVDGGDSPPFEDLLKAYLWNPGRISAVRSTLEHHVPKVGRPAWSIECTCGKTFAHSEEWTNHVRIRLYRVIMDEFPPIGKVE